MEGEYKTKDTERLTKEYPVDEVLGRYKSYWTSESLTGLHAASFLRNSPAQSSMAESMVLGVLIANAAKEGRWLGYDSGWTLEALASFNARRKTPDNLGNLERGLAYSIEAGLLDFEEAGGKVYVVPKEGLVKFVRDRARALEGRSHEQRGFYNSGTSPIPPFPGGMHR